MKTANSRLSKFLGVTLLVSPFAACTLRAQSALSENCDPHVIGVNHIKIFVSFDKELKEAIAKQDVGTLALLLRYPFRVNDERGSYYLHDAASFSARAQEIFTPAVRDVVLKQRVETIWCNYSGIMYGDGVVWVNPKDEGFAIEAVNVPSNTRSRSPISHPVEFACNAEKHRVIVDHSSNGNLRYRSWNNPRSALEKPDLEISGGKEQFEGTGTCAHKLWQFSSGSADFTAAEIGACDPDTPTHWADSKSLSKEEIQSSGGVTEHLPEPGATFLQDTAIHYYEDSCSAGSFSCILVNNFFLHPHGRHL